MCDHLKELTVTLTIVLLVAKVGESLSVSKKPAQILVWRDLMGLQL
jgi:hypothetical protein